MSSSVIQKYKSEMAGIFDGLEKDPNIGKSIERVIDESNELHEMQSKLILLIQKYTKEITDPVTGKKIKIDDDTIAEDITKFSTNLVKKRGVNDAEIEKLEDNNSKYPLDKNAKLAIKNAIKAFSIYEIYKVMNPRRIAGETQKDNYAHNMMMGGKKHASKYEGGKESDIKSYGKAAVSRIERASKSFQR